MVIGTYMMTNFDMQEIAPGIIDHKEWTPDNGRNNALRINYWELPVHSTRPFFGKSKSRTQAMEKIMPLIENFTRLSDRQNIRRDLPLPPLGRQLGCCTAC